MEKSMNFPQKIENELPYDPAISLSGIYLNEMKSLY